MNPSLTPSYLATLACLLEATAPKPGNVHRGADFDDLTFQQFVVSAVVLGESLEAGQADGLGPTVLRIVQRTRQTVGTNTNLGMALLLTPLYLAAIRSPGHRLTSERVADVLQGLDGRDGQLVFEAIRIAEAGGLGQADQLDVRTTEGEVDLLAAMNLAAPRDSIARAYGNGFSDLFSRGTRLLQAGLMLFKQVSSAIVFAHVGWMALEPDSLIARKCGAETAAQSQALAGKSIDILLGTADWRQRCSTDQPNEWIVDPPSCNQLEAFWHTVGELDFWLRSDGHRRNPGTTADLIAAALYIGLFNRDIDPAAVTEYNW